MIPGDILYSSADTSRGGVDTAYVMKKQITVYKQGSYRIKFDGRDGGTEGEYGYYIIRKNGVNYGTERIILYVGGEDRYTTFSEDLSGFASGDTIELWAHGTNGATYDCKNFRLYVNDYDNKVVNLD